MKECETSPARLQRVSISSRVATMEHHRKYVLSWLDGLLAAVPACAGAAAAYPGGLQSS